MTSFNPRALERPFRFGGLNWRPTDVRLDQGFNSSVVLHLSAHHIPKKRSIMADAWTGRKYRGTATGYVYEILTEPFDFKGVESVVSFEPNHNNGRPIVMNNSFANSDIFTRVIGPKYAVGDKVTSGHGAIYTIEAASSKPDYDGDFLYISLDSDGKTEPLWESQIDGKVSE